MLKRITENKLDISKIIDMPLLTTQIIYNGKNGSIGNSKKVDYYEDEDGYYFELIVKPNSAVREYFKNNFSEKCIFMEKFDLDIHCEEKFGYSYFLELTEDFHYCLFIEKDKEKIRKEKMRKLYKKVFDLVTDYEFSDENVDIFTDADYNENGVLIALSTPNFSKAEEILDNYLYSHLGRDFTYKELRNAPAGFVLNDEYRYYILIK